mgnify:CR=1 FL=1
MNLFAKKVESTHEIPFKICEPDPFWSEENQAFLKKAVADIKMEWMFQSMSLLRLTDEKTFGGGHKNDWTGSE